MITDDTILEYIVEFDVKKGEDGEDYPVPKSYDMLYYPEDLKFVLNNLLGGNKLIGDAVNKFLNDNWRVVMEEAGRPATKYVGKELFNVLIELCSKIPVKELFI